MNDRYMGLPKQSSNWRETSLCLLSKAKVSTRSSFKGPAHTRLIATLCVPAPFVRASIMKTSMRSARTRAPQGAGASVLPRQRARHSLVVVRAQKPEQQERVERDSKQTYEAGNAAFGDLLAGFRQVPEGRREEEARDQRCSARARNALTPTTTPNTTKNDLAMGRRARAQRAGDARRFVKSRRRRRGAVARRAGAARRPRGGGRAADQGAGAAGAGGACADVWRRRQAGQGRACVRWASCRERAAQHTPHTQQQLNNRAPPPPPS